MLQPLVISRHPRHLLTQTQKRRRPLWTLSSKKNIPEIMRLSTLPLCTNMKIRQSGSCTRGIRNGIIKHYSLVSLEISVQTLSICNLDVKTEHRTVFVLTDW